MRCATARSTVALVTSVMALSGCAVSRLQFSADQRLSFQAPPARSVVTTPLTVRWTMAGFRAVGLDGSSQDDRGAYVVFVDGAPIPVGKTLRWVAHGDASCQRDPRCPSQQYLADRGVYVTAQPQVTVPTLPRLTTGVGDEQHSLTVVLVDGTGRRIGESAWYLPVQAKRRSA